MTGSAAEDTTLLSTALCYATRSLGPLTARQLTAATPCAGWNLGMLLRHLDDSLAALHEGIAVGAVDLDAGNEDTLGTGDPADRLIASIHHRGDSLLGACRAVPPAYRTVTIGYVRMPVAMVAIAGAVELTVHGWDVARTRGYDDPIPEPLAGDLLRVLPAVVNSATRDGLFAAPVSVPAHSSPGDRLVALLGRSPAWDRGSAAL